MLEIENRREDIFRRGAESRDIGAENREKQVEEQEKKMAARERVEQVSKEVKNTKQQMQNILSNMQSVVKAVQAIRAQLAISGSSSIPSVELDKKTIEVLEKKLHNLRVELSDLKNALLAEEINSLRENGRFLEGEELEKEANERVTKMLFDLGLEKET